MRVYAFLLLLCLCLISMKCNQADSTKQGPDSEISVLELTIADIHSLFKEGKLSAEELVASYLSRIEKYDQATGLNAIRVINPKALEEAKRLDEEFQKTGKLRPMHGIPVIVKDNYNTVGLSTTAGSIALRGFMAKENATQVQQLVDAGAIVLAKSNMAEWAFSPKHTVGSIFGETRNPYGLDYVPAGSSGGTGAAVAANFGTIGLGTDTGNSIRGPSSHNCLVGFRSTLGLTSRYGIVPLYLRNDVGGPMCRTVEDATRVLELLAGPDPRDAVTAYSEGKVPENYQQFLDKNGLQGARIGIARQLTEDIHPEIDSIFVQALRDLESLGAEVVDPFMIPDFEAVRSNQWCAEFRKDIEDFLTTQVQWDSLQSLEDIIRLSGDSIIEDVVGSLNYFLTNEGRGEDSQIPCLDPYTDVRRVAYRKAIEDEMDRLNLDAIIYPSWNYPPARTETYAEDYKGDNSQIIAPHTGQPAFTVPMGFTKRGLPAGLQFLGRMYAEPVLIKLCFGYEQGTQHRRGPELLPI